MHQSKLVQLFKKMPAWDRNWFAKYLSSEFFCKHAETRHLVFLLLTDAPDFASAFLKKEVIFSEIYGASETYNLLKINNLVSDTLALLLDFLAFLESEKNEAARSFDSMDALLELEEHALFLTVARRFSGDKNRNLGAKSADFWRDEAAFFARLDRHFIQTGRRKFDENLQKQADALDRAFALDKMRLACAMISRNQVFKGGYETHFLADVRGWIAQREDWRTDPVFEMYETLLAMLERSQVIDYQRLVTLLADFETRLPPMELSAFWHYALNFCIRKINSGASDWYPETLRLYRALLDRGVLFRQFLSPWAYKNIVTAGLRTHDLAWTADFIEKFRAKLPPDERENAHAYNLAALFYEKSDFAAALETLQTVEFTDMSYALGAKIIQLKSWFQLGEEDALLGLLDSTKKWLARQSKMPESGRRANVNFLKIVRLLFHQKQLENIQLPNEVLQKRKILVKKIGKTEPLANKEWLLEMYPEALLRI
jgi:hypothetical protein